MPSLFMMECMALKIGMLQIGNVFFISVHILKRVKFLFLIQFLLSFFNNVIMPSLMSEQLPQDFNALLIFYCR